MRLPWLIPLRRSRRLFVVQTLLSALAVAAWWQLQLPAYALWSGWLVLVCAWGVGLRESAVQALRLGRDGELYCRLADGRLLAAFVLPGTSVNASWVLLRLRGEGLPASLFLLADSVDRQDDFRALRVWLRGRAEIAEAPSDDAA